VELHANVDNFKAKGARLVALAVQDVNIAREVSNLVDAAFPVLADAQHQAASAWGIYNLLNDNTAAPAVFVIDEQGRVIWSYIGKNTNDRPSATQILEQIP
jgi:peroxiredoxin